MRITSGYIFRRPAMIRRYRSAPDLLMEFNSSFFFDDIPEGRQAVFHDHAVMIVKEDDAEALPGGHLNEGFGVVSAVAEGGAQVHQRRRLFVGYGRWDKKEVRRGTKGKRKDGRDVNALEK